MDANLHNCGKLPWTILHDCIQCEKITNANNKLIYKYSCDNLKNFYFFSNKLSTLLGEFAKTSKNVKYNSTEWSSHYELFYGAGAQTSHLMALVCVYIQLNLLLLDFDKYIKKWNFEKDEIFNVCAGEAGWGHPAFLSEKFKGIRTNILENNNTLNVESIILIKNYLKIVFECMYCIVSIDQTIYKNGTLIFDHVSWLFSIPYEKREELLTFYKNK